MECVVDLNEVLKPFVYFLLKDSLVRGLFPLEVVSLLEVLLLMDYLIDLIPTIGDKAFIFPL